MRRIQAGTATAAGKARWATGIVAVFGVAVVLFLAPGWIEAYPGPAGYDLNCSDIGHQVRVDGADPYGLDGDNDGTGCEREMSFFWMPWLGIAGVIGFGIWATREVPNFRPPRDPELNGA